jgi:hypothetical protein
MKKNKAKAKEESNPVGRPIANVSKKIQACIRVEPHVKEAVVAKHGGLQAFFDHYAYKLVPKDKRPTKKK